MLTEERAVVAHPEAGGIDEDVRGNDCGDPPIEDIDLEIGTLRDHRRQVGIPDRSLDDGPEGDAAEASDDRALVADRFAAIDREVFSRTHA